MPAERGVSSTVGLEDVLANGQVMQGLGKPALLENLFGNTTRNPKGYVCTRQYVDREPQTEAVDLPTNNLIA
jgi:hypothetical protein